MLEFYEKDSLSERVVEELSYRLSEPVSKDLVLEMLQCFEDLGYVIASRRESVDYSRVSEFEETICRWYSDSGKSLEPSFVNGAQVLQSLESAGWLIIPA